MTAHVTVLKLLVLLFMGLCWTAGCQRSTYQVGEKKAETPEGHARSAPPAGYEFAKPIRLEAEGKVVSVEAPGYACPTMADVDGDGADDLVVGQFSQGNLQFFKNLAAAKESPQLAAAEWLKTGEERAIVPGVW
jgi:hypothetical protein